jgi:hypothetical protein
MEALPQTNDFLACIVSCGTGSLRLCPPRMKILNGWPLKICYFHFGVTSPAFGHNFGNFVTNFTRSRSTEGYLNILSCSVIFCKRLHSLLSVCLSVLLHLFLSWQISQLFSIIFKHFFLYLLSDTDFFHWCLRRSFHGRNTILFNFDYLIHLFTFIENVIPPAHFFTIILIL